MRKKIVTLLLVIAMVILAGCSGEESTRFMDDIKAKAMVEVAKLADEAKASAARMIIAGGEELDKQRAILAETAAGTVEKAAGVVETGSAAVENAGNAVSEVVEVPAEEQVKVISRQELF